MTIGIAVSGPMAGHAAFAALRAVERISRGAVGGFVSFVALTGDGRLLQADTQRGGTATLFTESEATGVLPPPSFASAGLAALMSSGPNRPEPLMQFTPADLRAGIVTGHRLPNLPGVDGEPLNVRVLARLRAGESPRQAVEAELLRNPQADAGLIALGLNGDIFAGDTALVQRRDDRGLLMDSDPVTGARCAILHNSILPVAAVAPLAAAVVFDTMAPADRADFHVLVGRSTRLELGEEHCLHLGRGDKAIRLVVNDPGWLAAACHGAALLHGAAVRREGKLIGRVIYEPYCVAENGTLMSLSGLEEANIPVRGIAGGAAAGRRALG